MPVSTAGSRGHEHNEEKKKRRSFTEALLRIAKRRCVRFLCRKLVRNPPPAQAITSKLRGLRTPLRPLRELAVLLLGARLSRAPFFLKSRSFQTPGKGVYLALKKLETSPPQTPNTAASRPGRVSESDLARLRLLLWSFRGGPLPLRGLGPFGHGFGWCMGMAGIGYMTR